MNLLEQLIDMRATRDDGQHEEAMATLLAGHSDADLDGLLNDALGRTESLGHIADDQRTDADADALECLVDVISALRTRQGVVAAARAERAKRMRSALDKVKSAAGDAGDGEHAKKNDGDGGEGGDGDGDEGEGEGGEGGGDGEPAAAPPAVRTARAEVVPVAAAVVTQRAPLGAMASDRPAPHFRNRPRPSGGSYTIEAASEMPGIAAGSDLGDLSGLAKVVHRRVMGLERAGSGHADIATIRRQVPEHYYAQMGADEETVTFEQLRQIADERSNALVASGGWCAPSEILYDLCPVASMEGLLEHPTVVVRRGGLRWPQTPDFSAIYSSVGFQQSESQAAAGTTKPCYDIPCPGFSESRLSAVGVCLRAGILTAQAYPELIDYYVQQSLVAHAHQVNAFKLAAMTTAATSVHFAATGTAPNMTTTYGPGAFSSILGVLEMQVEDLRAKYRWGIDETLECVAPVWVESLIRDDLSKRTGVALENVDDAMIADYFAKRTLRLQLVRDWQDGLVNSGTGFGGSSPIMAYPGTVGFLIYHPDTFIIGQADVIDLSAIYDSTNITTNTFTRLFSEEGVLVGRKCFEPRYVQIDVCPNGRTGGYVDPTTGWQFACPAA